MSRLRTLATSLAAIALFASASAQASTSGVVISQVFGGNGGTYNADYVELFNASSAPVTLTNWSIQYASATGTGLFSANGITTINTTLQPGQYYLIKLGSTSGSGSALTADLNGSTSTNMSSSSGKVILANVNTGLACNGGSTACNATQTAQIVDLVGYGTANYREGTAAPALNSATALFRGNQGCTDSNTNSTDFATGTPAPRNASSPLNACGTVTEQVIVPSCPATVNTALGVAVPVSLAATDSDSIVNNAALTSVVPAAAGISLGSLSAATADGGTATVNLNVGSGVAAGTYTATVEFANNEGQNASCSVAVTVTTTAASITPIYTIQGNGSLSPFDGSSVTTRGVVTKLTNAGFFMQDATGDGDDATSDGIFVYTASAPAVTPGQAVEVTGTVDEYDMSAGASPQSAAHPITELKLISKLIVTGQGSITPKIITLPESFDGELERYEGMLVTINTPLTVSQNYFQGRYGQVTLGADGRLFKPTMFHRPLTAGAIEAQDLNTRRSILLDDGNSDQNPNPIPYIGANNTLRAGDTVPSITGVIDYGLASSFTDGIADWKIHPTQAVSFTRANPRPTATPALGGNVKVASFNVLNYFNGNGSGGGYPTSRGAETAEEFTRQRNKIISAIQALNADVIGLEEIENDGTGSTSAIQDLVNGLNAVLGAGSYAVAPEPATGSGSDEIKVAIIYKPGTLNLLTGTSLSDTNAIFDRPPVAQGFSLKSNGEKFSVVMNHFKSKRCNSASGLDTDQGDGQGCYNDRRKQQAARLLTFVETVKTAAGDNDVLVMGDLNAYAKEDPVVVMTDGGLIDQMFRFEATPYSFVFDGEAGSLDQALATASLSAQISGLATWHINADEPSVIDYNTDFKPQDLYETHMYRSSDHDPVVVGLNLQTLAAQTIAFTPPGDKTLGAAPFAVSASASSGLPVALSSYTTAVCTVSGSTVSLVSAGTCTLAANQAGGAGYLPATEVTRSFTVKQAQTISFAPPPGTPLGNGSLTLNATASSGLDVSYTSLTLPVCTVSGNSVTLLAVGTCSIAADQAGNGEWNAATQVIQSFSITSGGSGGNGGEDGDVPIPAWALALLGASLFGTMRKRFK